MRALFIYVGHYGSSRCDTLEYVGLLPDGGDPIALIKERFDYKPSDPHAKWKQAPKLVSKLTGNELSYMAEGEHDGETSYVILDLDAPGTFLTSFEFEGNSLGAVKITPQDLGIEPL